MDIYHVLNRGVDKRNIFIDDKDRLRFIHNMYLLNDEDRINNNLFAFQRYNDIASHYKDKKRKNLVEILAFCLMSNHYHILLSPLVENGIPLFMKKLNMAYAKYFNIKHERTGALFEGRYKSILIEDQAHFIHIPYYIHFNPLDLIAPEWRDRKIKSYAKTINFLESYRWSSHLDYTGKTNFPSVIKKGFLLEVFGGENGYKNSMYNWLKELGVENFSNETLE